MTTTTLLLLSLGGAVIAAIVGSIWYSDKTPMGRLHMRYLGFDKLTKEEKKKMMEKAKPTMWKTYLGQLILSYLTAFWVVFVITLSIENGVPRMQAYLFPLFSWICFVVPTMGSGILWGNVDKKIAWKKFISDTLESLVTIMLIAFVAGFFA